MRLHAISTQVIWMHVMQSEDVACYTDEFKFNLQETSITNEEDSVSIEIIADDINFRPPPKRKKIGIAQESKVGATQNTHDVPYKPEARYCITCLHKDPRNPWRLSKHKWKLRTLPLRMVSSQKNLR